MFYSSRFLSLFFVFAVLLVQPVYSASVPITDGFGGLLGTDRNTCDPAFREVLNNRAWMEAQREVTQTQNIIARPDSVLSMSCFNQYLDQQAWYADNFFPGDPQNSAGGFGNIANQLLTVLPDRLISQADPNLTQGFVLFAVLEILVLDQLVEVDSVTGRLGDAIGVAACTAFNGAGPGDKDRYLENVNTTALPPTLPISAILDSSEPDNFPPFMLGNRANETGPYGYLSTIIPDEVDDSNAPPANYTCSMMNDVWTQAKCYDFATESSLSGYGPGVDHDGFYTLLDYVALAAASDDYREHITRCDAPDGNLFNAPSGGELACYTQTHGIPALPPLHIVAMAGTGTSGAPTWAAASGAANPTPGSAGAGETYQTYSDVLTGACSPPIQTGFLVNGFNNRTYIDAICPEPGCYFDPPTSTTSVGQCRAP